LNFKALLKTSIMTLQTKRLTAVLISVPLLLLIPFVAMQYTSQVNWSLFDFIIMGGLLLSTGLVLEFFLSKVKKKKYQVLVSLAVLLLFLITWAELAVGIFGTPFAGN
jgi:hypothetical protein